MHKPGQPHLPLAECGVQAELLLGLGWGFSVCCTRFPVVRRPGPWLHAAGVGCEPLKVVLAAAQWEGQAGLPGLRVYPVKTHCGPCPDG